jgi:hypothetical protein
MTIRIGFGFGAARWPVAKRRTEANNELPRTTSALWILERAKSEHHVAPLWQGWFKMGRRLRGNSDKTKPNPARRIYGRCRDGGVFLALG